MFPSGDKAAHPPCPACTPTADEGLTYVAVLASVARGAQAGAVSLHPGRSRRTPRPGPGGAAAPRETMSVKNTAACLGCSLAPETSRLGHKAPEAHEAGSGSACFWGLCPSWAPGPSISGRGRGALTEKGPSAQREVQGVPRQKEKENHQLPVPGAWVVSK